MVQKAIARKYTQQSSWRKHWARAKQACNPHPLVRIVVAWLLIWGVFVALALLSVVYARVFGPQLTQLALTSWSLAQVTASPLFTITITVPALTVCASRLFMQAPSL
jgi:uncharacterized membrane protein